MNPPIDLAMDIGAALNAIQNAIKEVEKRSKGATDEDKKLCRELELNLEVALDAIEASRTAIREHAEATGAYPPAGPDMEDVTGDPRHRGIAIPEGFLDE